MTDQPKELLRKIEGEAKQIIVRAAELGITGIESRTRGILEALASLRSLLESDAGEDFEKIHKAIVSVPLNFTGSHRIVDNALAAEERLKAKAKVGEAGTDAPEKTD